MRERGIEAKKAVSTSTRSKKPEWPKEVKNKESSIPRTDL